MVMARLEPWTSHAAAQFEDHPTTATPPTKPLIFNYLFIYFARERQIDVQML